MGEPTISFRPAGLMLVGGFLLLLSFSVGADETVPEEFVPPDIPPKKLAHEEKGEYHTPLAGQRGRVKLSDVQVFACARLPGVGSSRPDDH